MTPKKLKASSLTSNHSNQYGISKMDKDLASEAKIISNQKHRALKILRGLHKMRAKKLQELNTLLREKLLAEEKQKIIAQKYHKKHMQMRYKIRLKMWLKRLKKQRRTWMRVHNEHLQTTQKLNALRRKMHARHKRSKHALSYAKRMRELFESWRQVLKQLQLNRMRKELGEHQQRIRERNRNLRTRIIEIDNDINKVKWYMDSIKKFQMSPRFRISKALVDKIKSTLKSTLKQSSTKGSLLNLNDLYRDQVRRFKTRKIKQKEHVQIEDEQKKRTPVVYRVKAKDGIEPLEGDIERDIEPMVKILRYSKKGGKLGRQSLLDRKKEMEDELSELKKAVKMIKSPTSSSLQEVKHLRKFKKRPKIRKLFSSPAYEVEKIDPKTSITKLTEDRKSAKSENLKNFIKTPKQQIKKNKPVKSKKVIKKIKEIPIANSDEALNKFIKDVKVRKSNQQLGTEEAKVKFPNKIHKFKIHKSKSEDELYANQLQDVKRYKAQKKNEVKPHMTHDIMGTGDNETVSKTDSQIRQIESQEMARQLPLLKKENKKEVKGSGSVSAARKSSIDSKSLIDRREEKMQMKQKRISKIHRKPSEMRENDASLRLSIDSRESFGEKERIRSERVRISEIRKRSKEKRGSEGSSRRLSIDSRSSNGPKVKIKDISHIRSIESRNIAAYKEDIWKEIQKSHKEMIGDGATHAVKEKKKQNQKTDQLQEASKRYLKASRRSKTVLKPFSGTDQTIESLLKPSKDESTPVAKSRRSVVNESQKSHYSQGSIASIFLDKTLMPRISYLQDKPLKSVVAAIDDKDSSKSKSDYEDIKVLYELFIKRKVKLTPSELSVLQRYTANPGRYNILLEKMFEERFIEHQTHFEQEGLHAQSKTIRQGNDVPFPRNYSLATIKSEYSEIEEEPESMPTTDWTQPEFTKAYWDAHLSSIQKTPFQIKLQKDRLRREIEQLTEQKLPKKVVRETKKKKGRSLHMLYSNPRKTARERKIEEMYKNMEKPIEKCQSTCSDCCPCCNLPLSKGEQQKDKKTNELSSICSQCGGFIEKSNSTASFKSLCSMCDLWSSESKHPIEIPEIPDIIQYQCKVLRSACDLLTSHSTNRSDNIRYTTSSLMRLPIKSSNHK